MTMYALTVSRNTDKGPLISKWYYKSKNKATLKLRTKFNEEFGIYRYFPGYKRTTKEHSISCDLGNKNLGSVYVDKINVDKEEYYG